MEDKRAHKGEAQVVPGMRVMVRGQEWLVRSIEENSLGNQAVSCTGISELVRGLSAIFLTDLDSIIPIDPSQTVLVADDSPRYISTRLYLESAFRNRVPTDSRIHVAQHALMDTKSWQLEPASQALHQLRQRILIADAVGLGKTLEAGILVSELMARGKGRRILVVTAKSLMEQFQKEFWNRFSIPLVRLDSARIQNIRAQLPSNANPFYYYDKTIISVDTLKRAVEYGVYLENSYWDIIIIDEAQNVAERGIKSAKRAKLAAKLAGRSDTLIMLSATPHDGNPRSFASLMSMLDPTAIVDSEHYAPEDIKGLFVRRMRKDLPGDFVQRKVEMIPCKASAAEEQAFDVFAGMHLYMDASRRAGSGTLFKTTIEKALFSSPAACIKTCENRIAKLRRSKGDTHPDIASLQELVVALQAIGPHDFSRYQGLLTLLRSEDYGWEPKDTNDRLVIFTERIETMKWLAKHLREDLKLSEDQLVTMDGAMSDIEQQKIVRDFGQGDSPVRVLVASDVASEGINLHYRSHRLIHFDTPWSLMVFQQRNGRIDRYGQAIEPKISFLTVDAQNECIKGDARILQILMDKEQQAHENIGDPAMLMGKFNIDDENRVVSAAMEASDGVAAIERSLVSNTDLDPLQMLMAQMQSKDTDLEPPLDERSLMSSEEYLEAGIDMFGGNGVKAQRLLDVDGLRLEFDGPSPLKTRLDTEVPYAYKGKTVAVLSPDRAFCEREMMREREGQQLLKSSPQAQYLWPLHPILSWVDDCAATYLFERQQAPVVLCDRLSADDFIFLLTGCIPNKKGVPVIEEWFGLESNSQGLKLLSLEDVLRVTHIDRADIANTYDIQPSEMQEAQALVPEVIKMARGIMGEARNKYEEQISHKIDGELEKLSSLQKKHQAVVDEQFPKAQRVAKSHSVDELFNNYAEWVTQTLEVGSGSNVRILAVFAGE